LDLSAPAVEDQAGTVEDVLGDLGAADKPTVVALNKVDLLGPASRRRAVAALSERYPNAVPISAASRSGLDELLNAIDVASRGDAVPLEILVPYGREGVLAELRRIGGVERTEYVADGTHAWGWAPRHAARRFDDFAEKGAVRAPRRSTRRV
jgi:GTP-binding protein HflX